MAWVAVGAAAVGAVGGAYSANQNKKAAAAANKAAEVGTMADPRIANMLFGEGSNGGLLSQYQALGQAPQSPGLLSYGKGQDDYIGSNGLFDMAALRDASSGMMGSSIAAPTTQAAQAQAAQAGATPGVHTYGADVLWNKGETYSAPDAMRAAQVGAPGQVSGATVNQPQGMSATMASAAGINAPAQNGMDLSGSYDRFINSKPGENQFLKQATDGAIAQNRLGFQQMLDDSTRNLNENVLGGIRSNSVLSGQYGGSRQGIAEGRAMGDLAREQARAASMFGQNATNASVGAQVQAYESDSNRALSATQGLGAQQYGVAQQNAAHQQQTGLLNASAATGAAQTNYGGLLSGAMANAGYDQQAALANQGANLAASTTNASLLQDASKTNYAGQLGVNAGNAGNLQQANLANQNAGNTASIFGATQQQNASAANAQLLQQKEQFNTGLLSQNGQFNAGLQQQSGLANQSAQLNTNNLNSNNQQAGIAASAGLLGTALQGATNQDNYALNRAGAQNSLLQPYLSTNPAPQQQLTSNTAGSIFGGAATGLGLYNMYNNANKPPQYGGAIGNSSQPYGSNGVF